MPRRSSIIALVLLPACAPDAPSSSAPTLPHVMSLPSVGLEAHFDTDGLGIADDGTEALAIRTTAWGRPGTAREIGARTRTVASGRVTYAGDGLTEWWVTLDMGVEQGWTVTSAPPGDGPLVIQVELDGAVDLRVDGDSVAFGDRIGRTWRVGAVGAHDASGVTLGAWYEADGEGMRVVVDDTGARFPVQIDPVYTTAATSWYGDTDDNLGCSLAGADVNGDGYADVVIGAKGAGPDGRVYVYEGSATGPASTASTTINGVSDLVGQYLASAGDVDGDGYDDILMGAQSAASGFGAVWVYAGSASGLTTTAAVTLTGEASSSRFGSAIAGAGDVNGDGYDDAVVGAYYYGSGEGRAYVYLGSSGGLDSAASVTLEDNSGVYGMDYGRAVGGGGDVDGDGFDDVLVGCIECDGGSDGRIDVFLGSSGGIAGAADLALNPTGSSEELGYSVADAGDVNGDGYGDVVAGAYYGDRAYLYFGASTGPASAPSVTLEEPSGSSYFGYAVAGIGDADADGYDDVAVGDWGYTDATLGRLTGAVYVYRGAAAGPATSPDETIVGESAATYLGEVLVRVGDVNGDGFADLLTGGQGYDNTDGDAFLYLGFADDDADGVPQADDCDDANATVGAPSTRYADADSDGYGSTSAEVCPSVSGYIDVAGDCDDTDSSVSPAAAEVCDASNIDENCDGLADDASATGLSTFYADADGDGYGSATSISACDAPTGYIAAGGDCDDTSAAVSPAAVEVCDAADVDEDCDSLADDADAGAIGSSTTYPDADRDGYGDAASPTTACEVPAGNVVDGSDCDDTDAAVSPTATEVCDAAGVDENCDGLADDATASGQSTFYVDADGDGFGSATTTTACDVPDGYSSDGTDCDDTDADVSPAGVEVCDDAEVDEDCDGLADDADDSVTGQGIYYTDSDGDGYGTVPAVNACDASPGVVADATDCDDTRADVSPGGIEVCDDADVDEDCDNLADDADDSATGQGILYTDADGDGFGAIPAVNACDPSEGIVADATDCDDADPSAFPGGTEVEDDGVDQDCDGADATSPVAGDDTGGGGAKDEGTGCGCASTPSAGSALGAVGALVLLVRRRRALGR